MFDFVGFVQFVFFSVSMYERVNNDVTSGGQN